MDDQLEKEYMHTLLRMHLGSTVHITDGIGTVGEDILDNYLIGCQVFYFDALDKRYELVCNAYTRKDPDRMEWFSRDQMIDSDDSFGAILITEIDKRTDCFIPDKYWLGIAE